ncbi:MULTISPECIES: polysaccharide pyruvyl transferase family protein [Vibrio]|uniref:polysaccharide pyruvyl transferase family protein n=1 Tax=Vibrio TaxID=662 RepID=UPI00215D2618|nr:MULTISPECIES: polysaccharide pyruvyl transferase family protein [Vibrio]MCR9533327.1 polysaccharide pyruvyl transferase family protein [Vibrio alginolyticus]MDW2067527.1 polysaccharide pyruvyl transferase family protein [Vibrio sp. 1579]
MNKVKNKTLHVASTSGINIGDILIAQCVNKLITRNVVTADIKNENFEVSHPSSVNIKSRLINSLNRIPVLMPALKKIRFKVKTSKRINKLADQYDELIIGGGNLLFNKNGCDHLELCKEYTKIFKSKGKKVSYISVGVGPLEGKYESQLDYILKNADVITVRDQLSKNILADSKHYYRSDIEIIIDPVWYIPDIKVLEKKPTNKYFGINVMDFTKTKQFGSDKFQFENLIMNIYEISIKSNLKPIFIISAYTNDHVIMRKLSDELENRFGIKCSSITLPELNSKSEIWDVWLSLEFVISHRMHVSIMGLAFKIPTVVFPWQNKISGVLGSVLGTENILLTDVNFRSNEVLDKIKSQKENIKEIEKEIESSKVKYKKAYDDF